MLHRFDPYFELSNWPSHRRSFLGADVYRRGDTFYLEIDTPGVDLEDIDIEVEKAHLTVSVERRELVDDERTNVVRGRPSGKFTRRFYLGDGLDGENIVASYDNGVLTLSIPLVETAKARKIEISQGATPQLSN